MTSKPIAYTGLVTTGPLKGKPMTRPSPKHDIEGQGFYVWRAPRGPESSFWYWVSNVKKEGSK